MQNQEEDILKRFLQDTFSDYEPEPSEQTWENIRSAIQPDEPRLGGGFKRFIVPVVALLLLLSSVIVWNKKSEENTGEELAINTEKQPINQPLEKKTEKIKLTEIRKEHSPKTLIVNSVTPYSEEVDKLPIARQQSEELVLIDKTIKKSVIENEKVVSQPHLISLDENIALKERNSKLEKVQMTDENTLIKNLNSVESSAKVNGKKTTKSLLKAERSLIEKGETESLWSSSTNNISTNHSVLNHVEINDAVIEEIRYTKPVELLKNKDLVLAKNNFVSPAISEISINKDAKPIRRATYLSISLTPLQTYRILTVNNRGIQNLLRNGLFDPERNGFSFEIGITKPMGSTWNFRSGLSYLKMRQWAEYQISTDELLVKNIAQNANSIEQIGQSRAENKTHEMVGIKVDIQKFLSTSGRNRYFISTGTQMMYEPANGQANVFLNASAGFQHIINNKCFLTVEPTANYLLNNINDSKSLIQSSAYNLGLKVGFNFKVQ